MSGKDRISQLPPEILDNILGFLPIQEAARTAILSSSWRDIWFSLTKLNFGYGYEFFKYSDDAEGGESKSPAFDVVTKILMRHNGPIRKIVFDFHEEEYKFHFTDEFGDIVDLLNYSLNQWFLLLTQNGVEEIYLSCSNLNARCRVPNCIFSCPTLKRLKLSYVSVELMDADYVLPNLTSLCPNLTSLCLDDVDFWSPNCSDYVVYLPMLEDLSILGCEGILYFNIVAPKLGSLKLAPHYCSCCYRKEPFDVLPPNLDLGSISRLDLDCSACCLEKFIEGLTRVGRTRALNVEHLKLYFCSIDDCVNRDNSAFIHLLRACPKLCELDICRLSLPLNPGDIVLMEELSSVALTRKMLCTLKFSEFYGPRSQMQSIKVLLSCFQGIEKVVIVPVNQRERRMDPDIEFKIMQELLSFPCASTKANFFYIKQSHFDALPSMRELCFRDYFTWV